MYFAEFVSSIFKFRKTSLSILVIITYLAVIILQEVITGISLTPPKSEPSILTESWEHLQIISSSKHPFTSHKNDVLHDYLESVIELYADKIPYITTSIDRNENHTIFINQHDVFDKHNDANRIIYYESSNLLVKIQGSDSTLPGILLSAHYDSVPTSFGTTDDGMGIASMLAILKYFSESGKQPLRTLIFNFNNNEEFGLLGAEAFIDHKWFEEVQFFINLEGTGAGGLPILFRGTDKSVLDWYYSVSKPYANSLFQQGFNSGLISSQTDYHVYEKNGLRGIDIAFYLPRSFYHTYRDSIKYTTKGSLWMMISNTLDILIDVTNSTDNYESELGFSVYFDILNFWYFNFSLNVLFIFNVLLLVSVPTINLILLTIIARRKTWFIGLMGWTRFPVTLLVSYYAVIFLASYFHNMNPLLVSVCYYYPVLSIFSLVLLIGYIILNISSYLRPVHDQKLVIILEMNIISWCSLAWITYQINEHDNMGGYALTLLYIVTSISTICGLLGMIFRSSPCYEPKIITTVYGSNGNIPTVEGNDTNIIVSDSSLENPQVHDIRDDSHTSSDENTPLMNESTVVIKHETRATFLHNLKHSAINSLQYDWLIQFIMLVPLSVFCIYTEGSIVVGALHETVQENQLFDKTVWKFIMVFGGLLAIIILPFIHRLNFVTLQVLTILFVCSLTGSYLSPSYDESTPIKLRFVKTFDVNNNESLAKVYGRQGYISEILTEVPYLDDKDISCTGYNISGTEICSYEGHRPWLLSGSEEENSFENYLNMTVLSNTNSMTLESVESLDKFSPLESVIEIDVRGTRQCYMTFNTSNPKFKAPVKMVTLYKDGNVVDNDYNIDSEFNYMISPEKTVAIPNGMSKDKNGNWIFKLMKGIDLLEMHRLEWKDTESETNKFTIKIQWLPFMYDSDVEMIKNLGVNVECHWSDYDDIVMVNGTSHEKVQDYIDLMMYTDVGVVWTNLRPGIVQGNGYVEV